MRNYRNNLSREIDRPKRIYRWRVYRVEVAKKNSLCVQRRHLTCLCTVATFRKPRSHIGDSNGSGIAYGAGSRAKQCERAPHRRVRMQLLRCAQMRFVAVRNIRVCVRVRIGESAFPIHRTVRNEVTSLASKRSSLRALRAHAIRRLSSFINLLFSQPICQPNTKATPESWTVDRPNRREIEARSRLDLQRDTKADNCTDPRVCLSNRIESLDLQSRHRCNRGPKKTVAWRKSRAAHFFSPHASCRARKFETCALQSIVGVNSPLP